MRQSNLQSFGDDALVAEIQRLTAARGYSPSIGELADGMGVVRSTLHRRLLTLRKEGRVTWQENRPRTLRVTDEGDSP